MLQYKWYTDTCREAGTVVLARYYGSYGNCIIDHGNNVQTLYAHAERLKAKVGQSVAKGEVISWVGHTRKSLREDRKSSSF